MRFGLLWLVVAAALSLDAQTAAELKLPAQAVIVERAGIPRDIRRDRQLILWMISPEKHDRGEFSGSRSYTCPEWTLGSYYSGPTRISLVDTQTKTVLNTVNLHYRWNADSFDVPYRIIPDFYYLVPGHPPESEGTPALLALRDLNGDGLALETAFFEAEACMGLQTTMIGYSPTRDKVIQYQVELEVHGVDAPIVSTWVDYLFSIRPIAPGHWQFEIDYSGRGGALDSYDVRYNSSRERFSGSLLSVVPPDAIR